MATSYPIRRGLLDNGHVIQRCFVAREAVKHKKKALIQCTLCYGAVEKVTNEISPNQRRLVLDHITKHV